ncbi:MAG: flagellar basal body-associated FliL family protein [Opitutaceae bacterium]|jgi:flagellar FliL protein
MAEKKPDPAAAPSAEKAAAPVAPAPGGGIKALIPALLAIVLAPTITLVVAQYVLLPQFRASLAAAADPKTAAKTSKEASHEATKEAGKESAKGAKHGGKAGETTADGKSYKFEGVVVNLAGTMGTRYLKTTFLVSGEKPDLVARFDAARAPLGDVTIAVLSSLTLADLEESGSKNIIRERLLAAYNQALGERMVENLYFSEFVVQ